MAVAIQKSENYLGTFLSQRDMEAILPRHWRPSNARGRYFSDYEEIKIKQIMDTAQDLASLFYELYASKFVTEVLLQFQSLLPHILEEYQDKYFTKNHIATYFLAIFDYRLSMIGSKLFPKDIEYVRSSLGLRKGKVFSYFAMKRAQQLLFAAGFLKRRRNSVITPLLRVKIAQYVNKFRALFPSYDSQWDSLQDFANDLVDAKIIPHIELDEAAFTIVITLVPICIPQINSRVLWHTIRDNFDIPNIMILQRRAHRFRYRVRKNFIDNVFEKGVKNNSPTLLVCEARGGRRKFDSSFVVGGNT
ncbi:MAG: hypothetical protein ACTSYD_02720 [Candidatus Heimdallarchaeaceae archaeon]